MDCEHWHGHPRRCILQIAERSAFVLDSLPETKRIAERYLVYLFVK